MQNTHVYTLENGNVLFRRSGNVGHPIVECKIVTTHVVSTAAASVGDGEPEGATRVLVSAIATGYSPLFFRDWFADWTADDCATPEDFQLGRDVKVAIPLKFYDILRRGSTVSQVVPQNKGWRYPMARPYAFPVAAILINGKWQEPLYAPGLRSSGELSPDRITAEALRAFYEVAPVSVSVVLPAFAERRKRFPWFRR